METYAAILRGIARQLGCLPVVEEVNRPGVRAVYRVTVHYPDGRARDAVTTVLRMGGGDVALAQTVYRDWFQQKPLRRRMSLADYDVLTQAFQPSQFDRLPDQPNIPLYGVDLCLVERGAGSFVKGVIISPQRAEQPPYSTLLDLVRAYLPEAFREIE